MPEDICQLTLTARLTRDSELKYTNSGTAICTVSLAYTRRIKKGDSWEYKSCFLEGTIWGKRGESLNQFLSKGQQVSVTGELDFDSWEQDGVKRSKHKMLIDKLVLLGGRKEKAVTNQSSPFDSGNFEDDIPF